jgi:hypothetical protein
VKWQVIADKNHDDPVNVLIQRVLSTIEERVNLAKKINADQIRDEAFVRQRFEEMAADLELAYATIKKLKDTLHALTADPPPPEIVHALRSRSGKAQPVRITLGGKVHTFLVPSWGREDPIAEARLWQRITDQYGGA